MTHLEYLCYIYILKSYYQLDKEKQQIIQLTF